MFDQVHALLVDAIAAARVVAEEDAAWEAPASGSQAAQEQAAENARWPAPEDKDGSWPWDGAPVTAHWALWTMIEEATALPALLSPQVASYAADVVCRAVLEAGSLTWWLLDPGCDATRRTARWLAWRLHTAEENRKAVNDLNFDPADEASEYGETVESVRQDITKLGWSVPQPKDACPTNIKHTGKNKAGSSVVFDPGKKPEPWRRPTERVADLVKNFWPQGGLPYRRLSAVSHAELLGLSLNLAPISPDSSVLRPAPTPDAALWLWQDAYLVCGALVYTAGRAADFIGLDEYAAVLHALAGHLSQALATLRPAAP